VSRQAAARGDLEDVAVALGRAQASRDALAARQAAIDREATEQIRIQGLTVARLRQSAARLEGAVAAATVRAPIDGTVYSVPVRAGVRVQPGDTLATVGDLRVMQIRAFVDEAELGTVRAGQPVQATWNAVPDRVWHARVDRLPTAIVPRGERRVGEILCALDNADGKLIPGVDVEVRILVQSRTSALTIPREALYSDAAGRYVWAIRGGAIVRQAVSIDASSPTSHAIASGLREGDAIALTDDANLQDGMRIRVESEVP
jgi:HlyD family secretion protein